MPLDLVIVFPTDNSIGAAGTNLLRQYIKCFLGFLSVGDAIRVALISYADTAILQFDYNFYTTSSDIMNAIDTVQLSSSALSNYQNALNIIRNQLVSSSNRRSSSTRSWVIFLASRSSTDADATIVTNTALQLQQAGFTIQTIGLSSVCPNSLLYSMASPSLIDTTLKLYDCTYYGTQNYLLEQRFFKECE